MDRLNEGLIEKVADIRRELDALKAREQAANFWLPIGAAATYVSATSFTLVGDFTAYFKSGTKFRCVNSTTKYGYILSSSYSAPNTTVNLIANTSYALASAAITDVKISYASPPDFPAYLNYNCTLSGSTGSAGTYAEDLAYARYTVVGGLCHVVVRKRITNLGSWTGDVRLTYPVAKPTGIGGVFGGGYVYASAAAITAPKGIAAALSGSYCQFYKTILNYVQWADLAANDHVFLNLSYEV